MIVYLINYWLIAIYGTIKRNPQKIALFSGFLLFIVLALKSDTLGPDLDGYRLFFDYISTLPRGEFFRSLSWIRVEQRNVMFNGSLLTYKVEPAYLILCWIIGRAGGSFRLFLLVCSTFFIISVTSFFMRYSKDVTVSFLMFCALGSYGYCFGILRQMLAVCVVLWAIPFIEKKEIIRPLLFICIAFFFHRTILVAIPLVFLGRVKLTKIKYNVLLALMLFTVAVTPFVISPIMSIVYSFFYKGSQAVSRFPRFSTLDIIIAIVLVLVLLFYRFEDNESAKDNIGLWALVLLAFLRIIVSYATSFARSEQIYFMLCYVMIANFIDRWKIGVNREAIRLILATVLFAYYIHVLAGSPIVPYRIV